MRRQMTLGIRWLATLFVVAVLAGCAGIDTETDPQVMTEKDAIDGLVQPAGGGLFGF